ncbi:MAG: hypothetical protein JST30_16810 [Armatimonadetes bacterium]|nr:hypothetical protein [Armatimonadota bacterium]
MLIGNVLAAVATVFTAAIALLCTMVLTSLLFPARSARAAKEVEAHPWKCALTGLVLGGAFFLVGTVLFQIPNPVTRTLGVLVYLVFVLVACAGSGGLARLVASRIDARNSSEAPLWAVAVGAALVVGSSLLPVVGWALLAPLILVVSLGAGLRSGRKDRAPVPIVGAEAS